MEQTGCKGFFQHALLLGEEKREQGSFRSSYSCSACWTAERGGEATGDSAEVAFVDQGYTGAQATEAAAEGILLDVVTLAATKREALCCCLGARWSNGATPG